MQRSLLCTSTLLETLGVFRQKRWLSLSAKHSNYLKPALKPQDAAGQRTRFASPQRARTSRGPFRAQQFGRSPREDAPAGDILDVSNPTRAKMLQEAHKLTQKVLDLRRVVKVTKGGKVYSYSLLVAVGDRSGQVGLGFAKANEVPEAIEKATLLAYQSMAHVPISSQKSIFHELKHKFKASYIALRPAPQEFGMRTNEVIANICEAAGIENLSGKVIGSTNALNVAYGTFEALRSQLDPLTMARLRGKRLVDLNTIAAPPSARTTATHRGAFTNK